MENPRQDNADAPAATPAERTGSAGDEDEENGELHR